MAPPSRNILRKYGNETGIYAEVNELCVHSLRAISGDQCLSNEADIAKVQECSAMRTSPPPGSKAQISCLAKSGI
jgi:hypothetical protein